jgi:branched-chain amino acid transport system substrate-binding protein
VSAIRSTARSWPLRHRGRSLQVVAACVALLTIAACSSAKSSTGGSSAASSGGSASASVDASPVSIGTVLPLSGSLAATAAQWLAGMNAEIAEVNAAGGAGGHKINLVKVDDAFQIPKTISGIKELAQSDKVSAIIGPFGTSAGIAAAPVAAQVATPLVGGLSYTTALFKPAQKYIFALFPGTDQVYGALTTYAINQLHAKKIAFIGANDPTGDLASAGMTIAASSGGAQIVSNVRITGTEADYAGVIAQVAATKPDVLLIDATTPQTTKMVLDMQRANVVIPTIGGLSGADAAFPPAAGAAGEGVYGATYIDLSGSAPGWAKYSASMAAYTQVAASNAYAAAGYVAMQVIAQSLAKVKGVVTANSLRDAIEKTPITSLAGTLQFSPTNHLGNPVLIITQIKSGKITPTGTKVPIS